MPLTAVRRVASGPALLTAGLFLVGAADAIVLGLTTGYFGAGYNSPALRGGTAIGAFIAAGAVLDTFLLPAVFVSAAQVGRAFRLQGLARLAFASALTLFLPVAFDVVSHRLHRVFGQVLGFDALIQLAGGHLGDAVLEA
jgi:sorbitol-specific phosphotransferase system component IIBC